MKDLQLDLTSIISEISPKHYDILEKNAEMISKNQAKFLDNFFTIHIKKKPRWMTKKQYEFLLGELVELTRFQSV